MPIGEGPKRVGLLRAARLGQSPTAAVQISGHPERRTGDLPHQQLWYGFGCTVLRLVRLGVLGVVALGARAADWELARNAHFEVYAQAEPESTRSLLLWLEQLRAFFRQQTGVKLEERRPVRVLAFASTADYEPYRLKPASDAYYVGTEGRDFIVMAGAGNFPVAAHEYTHLILRARGLRLPPWAGEGLAEVFSSVRLGGRGGLDPRETEGRYHLLRTHAWMPLGELLNMPAASPTRENRDTSHLFYAESWALTGLLMSSAKYGPRFPELVTALSSGTAGAPALARVYAKPLEVIEHDLHTWVEKRRFTPVQAADLAPVGVDMETSAAPPFLVRSVLAEVLVATGKVDRAETLYRQLLAEAPDDGDIAAALAMIALARNEFPQARRQWQRALEHGVRDASVCYRYAVLGQKAGFAAEDIRPALERAVALDPAFDDALYNLALLENDAGAYAAAVGHLQAMRQVAPGRQFAYWIAMASALMDLGRGEEAKAAADAAKLHATTADERGHATQLGILAVTDPVVQFTRDASGNMTLVTARAPHTGEEWNPFIEPGDQIRRAEADLREIECGEKTTTFVLQTATGILRLTLPDPSHVQMRKAPPEFTCGPQKRTPVVAVYAVSGANGGLLRGLEFR